MTPVHGRDAARGFSLIEAIVVLAVLALAMFIGAPVFSNMLRRSKTESTVLQVASQARSARLQSVKESVQFYLQVDLAGKRVLTFRESGVAAGFNPASDEQVQETPLPAVGLDLGGPGAPDPDGTDPTPGLSVDDHLTFRPDGSTDVAGAIRFDDKRGNYLEVRIGPMASGRVQVRKWDPATSAWRVKGEGGKEWKWT
jgi:prepilin-type N-terminal cleavage/methylation domain-containing protein